MNFEKSIVRTLFDFKQIAVAAQPDGVVCIGLRAFPSHPGELIEIL